MSGRTCARRRRGARHRHVRAPPAPPEQRGTFAQPVRSCRGTTTRAPARGSFQTAGWLKWCGQWPAHGCSRGATRARDLRSGHRTAGTRRRGPRAAVGAGGPLARFSASWRLARDVIRRTIVVCPTVSRRILWFLLVLAVSANGATVMAAAKVQDVQCSSKGHACGGASIASCCCRDPVEHRPSTEPDGRADARPPVEVHAVTPPSAGPGEAPRSAVISAIPRARSLTPLIHLFSTLLI